MCAQLSSDFVESTKPVAPPPFVSPFAGQVAATAGEQLAWSYEEKAAAKKYVSTPVDVTGKFMVFDREKTHATLSTA